MVGDLVCVLLGCFMPLVLRPQGRDQYSIVHRCWLHGLLHAEALLGQLPAPWRLRYNGGGDAIEYLNTDNGAISTEDPRLPELAVEWERMSVERAPGDPYLFAYFRNKNTREVINSDPRLLPEALKDRGVSLETLRLV